MLSVINILAAFILLWTTAAWFEYPLDVRLLATCAWYDKYPNTVNRAPPAAPKATVPQSPPAMAVPAAPVAVPAAPKPPVAAVAAAVAAAASATLVVPDDDACLVPLPRVP